MALLVQGADRLPVAAVGTLEPLQRGDEQGIRGREAEAQVEEGARVGVVQAPGPVTFDTRGGVEGQTHRAAGGLGYLQAAPAGQLPAQQRAEVASRRVQIGDPGSADRTRRSCAGRRPAGVPRQGGGPGPAAAGGARAS